jgi:hypothetical protein
MAQFAWKMYCVMDKGEAETGMGTEVWLHRRDGDGKYLTDKKKEGARPRPRHEEKQKESNKFLPYQWARVQ